MRAGECHVRDTPQSPPSIERNGADAFLTTKASGSNDILGRIKKSGATAVIPTATTPPYRSTTFSIGSSSGVDVQPSSRRRSKAPLHLSQSHGQWSGFANSVTRPCERYRALKKVAALVGINETTSQLLQPSLLKGPLIVV
jgi:hypothetical protein